MASRISDIAGNTGGIAVEDNLSAQASCIGADIYQMVGSTHDLLIVLYHNDGITQRLQFLQHMDQPVGVARVEADTGLIEDIERSYERTA